jgi:hypothetical protein
MEFATDQHRVHYERIKGWAEQLFGEAAEPLDDRPSLRVMSGDETVFVHVVGFEDGGVWLNLRTWPCDRLKAPDSALRRMLEINASSMVGALQVEDLGEIEFVYVTQGESLTKDSFKFLFYLFAHCARDASAELNSLVT